MANSQTPSNPTATGTKNGSRAIDLGHQSDQKGQLDQLVNFMKENWKPVLSELVSAGVTAYMAYNEKSKKELKN